MFDNRRQGCNNATLRNGRMCVFGKNESIAPDQPPAGTSAHGATAQHRLRIKEHLMANGPTSQQDLVRHCGVPSGSLSAVLKHEWFAQTDRGIQLTRSLKMEPY